MKDQSVRQIARKGRGVPTQDGAGVKLTRVLGTAQIEMHDPFLMLDEFGSDVANDYIAGFPDHPHRGFETVTYMLNGRMRHKDSVGNEGVIETGGVQWMSAGRGIVHSEMPEQEEGLMRGFQLWINLPAAQKMKEPGYQEFGEEDIPADRREDGAVIKVIAGATARGIEGPVRNVPTQPKYFDIHLPAGAELTEPVPAGHEVFLYCFEGEVAVGDDALAKGDIGLLGPGEQIRISGRGEDNRVLLVAGRPLREPVAWGGPFVMNTKAEVLQAFEEYRSGRFPG